MWKTYGLLSQKKRRGRRRRRKRKNMSRNLGSTVQGDRMG